MTDAISPEVILRRGKAVLRSEAEAIHVLEGRLTDPFVDAVRLLLECQGRVVCTGIGKAGAVSRKLAATLASTGTPAFYLHPAEGVHGDLGMVTPEDVVLALSHSGESDEVVRLLPPLRRIGATLIAMTGAAGSSLGRAAQVILDVSVGSEACPLGLAPTTSTTAMLALGDALALAAMEARGFTREDFAKFHPAGALGRRLTTRVSDVMRSGEQMALVPVDAKLVDAVCAITRAGAGAAFLVKDGGILEGIITDGDIRRAIVQDAQALSKPAAAFMNRDPMVVAGNPLAVEALNLLQESPRRPGEAPVVDSQGRVVGLIMLKDLLRAGIV